MKSKQTESQLAREAQANRAFTKRVNDVRASDHVLAQEAKRISVTAAKTGKLRALREARDAKAHADEAPQGTETVSRAPARE